MLGENCSLFAMPMFVFGTGTALLENSKFAATTIVPDRLDAEPPAGLTLLTLAVLFVTLNPVDKLWLIIFFV